MSNAQCPTETLILIDTFVQWIRRRASANLAVTRSDIERENMDGTNGLKETTRITAPAPAASNPPESNPLNVNVFTAPGKAMVGERPKPLGEAFGFDPITSTLIFGEYDAVLVDAMGTVAEAKGAGGGRPKRCPH